MRRIGRYLRWLLTTSWPAYAAGVFLANLVGAIGLAGLLFLLPTQELTGTDDITSPTIIMLVTYLVLAMISGMVLTYQVFKPVLTWQRDHNREDPARVRRLIVRIPIYQSAIGLFIWGIGVLLFSITAALHDKRFGLVIAITATLIGLTVALMTYFIAERLIRPIAVEALNREAPEASLEPPISQRLSLTWLLTSGVPAIGILLVLLAQEMGYFTGDAVDVIPAILGLTALSLVSGLVGTQLMAMSIVDPVRDLTSAINRVRRGNTDIAVPIYDGSEMGVLQVGFNEMLRGLRERQRVRELFGRYVGDEVARNALAVNPVLGGEERQVAVLFVDVIGSTRYAVDNPPEIVVRELNKFFEHVVDCVHRNKGIINKFQGDAALAVFGAPLPLDDTAGHALTAARELRAALRDLELDAGIGVSAGRVVAGHIGAHDRFEYTVIGDAVNQAARLTDLAKDTPGAVLATAATVRQANEDEQRRWTSLKSVELRGRTHMTQLARPIRPTLAERS